MTKYEYIDKLLAEGKITHDEAKRRYREIDKIERERAHDAAVEQYWKDQQGEEYGSY